ncbi:MAG: hypothetical protein IKL20_06155 [Alistipes sp.]|nr:hypothetical protein [Alistipes sp.]
MKKFLCFLLSAATLLVACEPDNSVDNNETGLPLNSYSINENKAQLQSVAVDMLGENIYIVATPTANLTTAAEIFESDEYVFVAVSPLLVGKTFDLKTESKLYTVTSTLSGAKLDNVTPSDNKAISAGTATLSYENGVAVVKADITLKSGTVLKVHASAANELSLNNNIISRGDEYKPLRAAFYDEGDYSTTLYFTPAGAEYYGELEDVSWYMYIGVSNLLLDGKTHSLAELGGTSSFEFGVIDNVSDMKSTEIMAGFLRGATGEFTILKTAAATYKADINITIQGVTYTASFEDECISVDYAPEKPTNFFTYKGTDYTVLSATLTQGAEVWSVEIATSSGKNVVLNAPKAFFNSGDGGRGFSQSADFTVEYDGTVYSKANGYSGTIISAYDEATQHLALDFFNNSDVKFNYTGTVEVK